MVYLGIDIGGTNIAAAIVDNDMRILGRGKRKTRIGSTAEEFCASLVESADSAAQEAGISISDCAWCGIGCPGAVDSRSGVVMYSNNLRIDHLPLRDMMQERLGLPIYIENDANCAALGEVAAGAAVGAESALVITLGTGVGGGIVIGGRIYSGINGVSGEVGHMVICSGGEQCTCGRKGCWEAYSSAAALKRQTRTAMESDHGSLMWKYAPTLDKVSGKTAFLAMREGDASGRKVVENYIFYLAEGLTNVINILQPEVVCIGGGVSHEGDPLLVPLREQVERNRFARGELRQPRIVAAKLFGDAGIIGAAVLGRGL